MDQPRRVGSDPASRATDRGGGAAVDVDELVERYLDDRPDPGEPGQRVDFGTSGHRGSSLTTSFNEAHLLAITQAVVEERAAQGVTGPLFLGRDTHALSVPAERTVLEVLVAAGVEVRVDDRGAATPTPVVSHAILAHNGRWPDHPADGLIVTPSHNPPEDGGIKYNPPHGGPAGGAITARIEERANELLAELLTAPDRIARTPPGTSGQAGQVVAHPFLTDYLDDLGSVIDVGSIASSGLTIGADPLGGATLDYWAAMAERLGIDVEVVNDRLDPTFAFMPPDHDGRIRMDCSSSASMAGLVASAGRFDLAVGNDPDGDRHGIVVPGHGLQDPNGYLAVMIEHLLATRDWDPGVAVGKTVVSSLLIDRVVAAAGRQLVEVPVGFKWFVEGLHRGRLGFGGEESAGASFLRRGGTVWTTDKDGMIAALLAAEMLAADGRDPALRRRALAERHGDLHYRRIDAPADRAAKAALGALTPAAFTAASDASPAGGRLAGDPITGVATTAPGNDEPIGGLKVTTDRGWFAARPSGTEDVVKVYAESTVGRDHLDRLLDEARELLAAASE